MRGVGFFAFAVCLSGNAFADPWDITVYIPAQTGGGAQTLNLETLKSLNVLEGVKGKRAHVCPPDAFWAIVEARIVSCSDGAIFDLKATTKVGKTGAFALIPSF